MVGITRSKIIFAPVDWNKKGGWPTSDDEPPFCEAIGVTMEGWMNLFLARVFLGPGPQNDATFEGFSDP